MEEQVKTLQSQLVDLIVRVEELERKLKERSRPAHPIFPSFRGAAMRSFALRPRISSPHPFRPSSPSPEVWRTIEKLFDSNVTDPL